MSKNDEDGFGNIMTEDFKENLVDEESQSEEIEISSTDAEPISAGRTLPAGERLKQERQDQGLSLESVHEATNIPLDALRAIEEGYTVRTLSAFYLKGFIKIYAKYLDVDVNQLIEGHKEVRSYKYIKPNKKTVEYGEILTNLFTKEVKQKIVLFLGALLVLFVLFKITSFVFEFLGKNKQNSVKKNIVSVEKPQVTIQPERKKPTIKSPLKMAEKKAESVAVVRTEAPVSALSQAMPKTPADKAIARNVTLTVRAKEEGWLRVVSDDVVVYQSTLPLGAVETWMADQQIEISGRNINELEFELNGKMIGSLGRADRKAKTLIVTKDGLTVTK